MFLCDFARRSLRPALPKYLRILACLKFLPFHRYKGRPSEMQILIGNAPFGVCDNASIDRMVCDWTFCKRMHNSGHSRMPLWQFGKSPPSYDVATTPPEAIVPKRGGFVIQRRPAEYSTRWLGASCCCCSSHLGRSVGAAAVNVSRNRTANRDSPFTIHVIRRSSSRRYSPAH